MNAGFMILLLVIAIALISNTISKAQDKKAVKLERQSGRAVNDVPASSRSQSSTFPRPNWQQIEQEEIARSSGIPQDRQLSKHYKLSDLMLGKPASQWPTDPNILSGLQALAQKILDPIKDWYPGLVLNSVFRAPPAGQHGTGQAADLKVPGKTFAEIYNWIKMAHLPYDQLILEKTPWHIHVSHVHNGTNRQMAWEETLENPV